MVPAQVIAYSDITVDAWRRLECAADDPTHPMRLLAVATVDAVLRPAARILVLRGASRDPPRLWFHTDARAAKVRQLGRQSAVCAVGYDGRDGVQLRIDGHARVHLDDRITDAHWAQTDLAVRYAYATAPPPGSPVETAAETDPRSSLHRHRLDEGRAEVGRTHFAVIEVVVESIEWFQATTTLQQRALLREKSGWAAMPLSP